MQISFTADPKVLDSSCEVGVYCGIHHGNVSVCLSLFYRTAGTPTQCRIRFRAELIIMW